MPPWQIPTPNRDFSYFWLAGKLAAGGHAAGAYDLAAMKTAAAAYRLPMINIEFPYPPHVLLLAAPLSVLPIGLSYVLWTLVSAALFVLASRPYLPSGMPRVLAVLTPAALICAIFGQIGLFFGALWLWCFNGSAVAAALLSIKPNLAVPAIGEVLRAHSLLRTTAIFSGIVLLSVLLLGAEPWRAYLGGAATNHLKVLQQGHYVNWYVQMTTPYLGYGLIGWIGFAVASIVLLTRRFDVFTAATAAFLISPYGFHYDMTVVCLGFGMFLFERWRSIPPWHVFACALAFLSPALVRAGTWLVPPILLVGLYIQTGWKQSAEEVTPSHR
jgi:alpha-1,2-mannosyltransferase